MEFIRFLFSLLIVYCGIFLGIFLGWISKEELKKGKSYFLLMQNILLVAISALFFLFNLNKPIWMVFFVALISIYLYYTHKKLKTFFKCFLDENLAYLSFGIMAFFSLGNTINLFTILALIFVYGLPTGTLIYYSKQKIAIESLKKGVFVLIPLLLFLLFIA